MVRSGGFNRLFGTPTFEAVTSVYRIVGAADGGWSLTPMENLLRGVRTENETLALELYSFDGVVNYCLRSQHGSGLVGMLKSYFPQAKVSTVSGDLDSEDVSDDWLDLGQEEFAFVQTMYLENESYLPLRIFDDPTLRQSEMDPLAGVIGLLGNSSRSDGEFPGFRLGMRLVVRPAKESWNMPWRDRIQQRRDGDDRPRQNPAEGPPLGLVLGGLGLVGFAAANYFLWQAGQTSWLVPANIGMVGLGAAGLALAPKLSSNRRRSYIDDHLVEDKLKSLAFTSEMQLVAIYREVEDTDRVKGALSALVDCLRSYDDAVGNSWRLGRLTEYQGMDYHTDKAAGVYISYPFRGGKLNMDWMSKSDAMKTVLSAREVASLWHPPLGTDEMASMERSTSVQLIPYLGDLAHGTDSTGPHVGGAGVALDSPIFLPESALRKHTLILGRSGVGKSTMVKHILSYKLHRKAQGLDDAAIVVIDPHADLVHDVLLTVPPELVPKIRLLDFGRLDRVPGINLLDPELFTDRDRCVDTIVTTLRYLWEAWGNRLEDLLKRSLLMMYEYNAHPDTPRESYLTMMDILKLLDDGVNSSGGPSQEPQFSPFQNQVISRVKDPSLISWFRQYLNWGRETKGDAVGPVHSRIGAYESNLRSSVIMGQRESTLLLSDVLEEGLVLLVSTAQGTIGVQPAALMGGTMVSLVESALRDQESIPSSERKRCTLFCDEFQTVTGANWEGMLAEIRKYGGSLVLATQSVVRLDQGERRLRSGVLANTGCIVSYQVSGEDAHVICQEMNAERVAPHHLVDLDAHHCIVRINSDTKCYSAFSMKTKPPPEFTHRYDDSVAAVLKASEAYTIDWATARAGIEAEGMRKLHGGTSGGSHPEELGVGAAPSRPPRNNVDASADDRRRRAQEARELAVASTQGSAGGPGPEAAGEDEPESPDSGPSGGSPGPGPSVPRPSGGAAAFSAGPAEGASDVDPSFGRALAESTESVEPEHSGASQPGVSRQPDSVIGSGLPRSEASSRGGRPLSSTFGFNPARAGNTAVADRPPAGFAAVKEAVPLETLVGCPPADSASISDQPVDDPGLSRAPEADHFPAVAAAPVDAAGELLSVEPVVEGPDKAVDESAAADVPCSSAVDDLVFQDGPDSGSPSASSDFPCESEPGTAPVVGTVDTAAPVVALAGAAEFGPGPGEEVRVGDLAIPVSQLSLGNFYDLVESCRSHSSFSDAFVAELERVGPSDPLLQRLLRGYLGDSWNSIRRQAVESGHDVVRKELRPALEAQLQARYAHENERLRLRIDELHSFLKVDYGVSEIDQALEAFLKRPTVEDVKSRTNVELDSTLEDQRAGVQTLKRRTRK